MIPNDYEQDHLRWESCAFHYSDPTLHQLTLKMSFISFETSARTKIYFESQAFVWKSKEKNFEQSTGKAANSNLSNEMFGFSSSLL